MNIYMFVFRLIIFFGLDTQLQMVIPKDQWSAANSLDLSDATIQSQKDKLLSGCPSAPGSMKHDKTLTFNEQIFQLRKPFLN